MGLEELVLAYMGQGAALVSMTTPFGPTVMLCFGPTLLVRVVLAPAAAGWRWGQVLAAPFLAARVARSR